MWGRQRASDRARLSRAWSTDAPGYSAVRTPCRLRICAMAFMGALCAPHVLAQDTLGHESQASVRRLSWVVGAGLGAAQVFDKSFEKINLSAQPGVNIALSQSRDLRIVAEVAYGIANLGTASPPWWALHFYPSLRFNSHRAYVFEIGPVIGMARALGAMDAVVVPVFGIRLAPLSFRLGASRAVELSFWLSAEYAPGPALYHRQARVGVTLSYVFHD